MVSLNVQGRLIRSVSAYQSRNNLRDRSWSIDEKFRWPGAGDPSEQMILLFLCEPDDNLVKNSFAGLNNKTKQNLPPTTHCLFRVFFSLRYKFTADIVLGVGWLPTAVVPQKCTESLSVSQKETQGTKMSKEKICKVIRDRLRSK